jgi:DNA repair photolyase
MFPAYFDNWTPELVRPADIKSFEKMLSLAYSDKETKNRIALGLRKGIAFGLGVRSEPFLLPIERETETTLKILKLFKEYNHPVLLLVKSNLPAKSPYFDVLSEMKVATVISIIAGDQRKIAKLEPHAPSSKERWQAIKTLNESGLWAAVKFEPVLPSINDSEDELRRFGAEALESDCQHITFYNYHASRKPMAKSNFEKKGFDFDKLWNANKDEAWQPNAKRIMKLFKSTGIPTSTADWVNMPFDSACESCCGIDLIWKNGFDKFTFRHACAVLKESGEVRWKDMVNANPTLYNEEDFNLMKRLWNDVDEKMYGMRDLYDNYYIDAAGEDKDGMTIWKRRSTKPDLLSLVEGE